MGSNNNMLIAHLTPDIKHMHFRGTRHYLHQVYLHITNQAPNCLYLRWVQTHLWCLEPWLVSTWTTPPIQSIHRCRRRRSHSQTWGLLQYIATTYGTCLSGYNYSDHLADIFRMVDVLYNTSPFHYNDVMMRVMASKITSLTIVYSTVYSGADQRKHQSSASQAFVRGIHRYRWLPRTRASNAENIFILWRHHVQHDTHEMHSYPIHERGMGCCFWARIFIYISLSSSRLTVNKNFRYRMLIQVDVHMWLDNIYGIKHYCFQMLST